MSRTLRSVVIGIGVAAAMTAVSPPASLADAVPASSVAVRGAIAQYEISGAAVKIVALANGRCRALSWVPGSPAGKAHAVSRALCADARTPAESMHMAEAARGQVPAPVLSGKLSVAVSPGALDEPQMLVVRSRATGGILHRWPLPDEVSSLAVGHGIAVLATVRHQGLYAVRLNDGRLRIVGLMGWLDRPVLGRMGIVFRDDMYGRRNERRGQAVLQRLTWNDVDAALDDASTSYSAAGAQPAWAYDGQRVVMAMRDPSIPCDRVHFWNVAWDRRVQLTQVEDHICPGGAGTPREGAGAGRRARRLARRESCRAALVDQRDDRGLRGTRRRQGSGRERRSECSRAGRRRRPGCLLGHRGSRRAGDLERPRLAAAACGGRRSCRAPARSRSRPTMIAWRP